MVEKIIKSDHKGGPEESNQAFKKSQDLAALRSLELSYIQEKLKNFHSTILKDVDKRMTIMIDEIMQEIRQHELQTKEFQSFAKNTIQTETTFQNTWNNREINSNLIDLSQGNKDEIAKDSSDEMDSKKLQNPKRKKVKKRLPEKVFVTRESYLTALLQIPHMKSIYHIFYIILVLYLLNSMCHDYFVEGRINLGLGTFKIGLAKLHLVLGILVIENILVISLYYAFKGWATIRTVLAPQQTLQSFWSYCCLITYIGFQIVFYYVASALCLKLDLPFVTASVLLLESTRLLMKMHSFIRVNAARQINGKLKSDGENMIAPLAPISCYVYFLFAPTLIYRDNYPRTSHIRWKFAINRLLEVVAIAFLYSYIHEHHLRVNFANYGLEPVTASDILVKFFGMLMPANVILLCGFYMILHAWLNFTSELLRFGDRMFYKDWWTSHNYDAYFRNWNVVVHDWLYEYIYKDFYNYVFKGSKLGASLMVFFISSLIHEHILSHALQLFFPVMFIEFFVIGVFSIFLTRLLPRTLGNLFLWFSLIVGNCTMIFLYCMEYYAVPNCPKTYDSWTNIFTPAIWSCYRK